MSWKQKYKYHLFVFGKQVTKYHQWQNIRFTTNPHIKKYLIPNQWAIKFLGCFQSYLSLKLEVVLLPFPFSLFPLAVTCISDSLITSSFFFIASCTSPLIMYTISCLSRLHFQKSKSTNRKFLQKSFKIHGSSTTLPLPSLLKTPSTPHTYSFQIPQKNQKYSWWVQLASIDSLQEILKVCFVPNTKKHIYFTQQSFS